MADSAAGFVRIERPLPEVAVIRIDRPERRNALTIAVRRDIAGAVARAEADAAVRAMILAGGASCFASGGDIVENAKLSAIENMHRGREKRALWDVLASATKPLVAAVRGYALGGGAELMMLADIIVASRTARIGQPEPRVGIMPGSGGTQRLPRAVGKYAAMKVLLTGGTLTGEEAQRLGLVSEAVEDAQVEPRALAMARAIAANAPLAVAAAKAAALAAEDAPLSAGLLVETQSICALAATHDCREGIAAWLENRAPVFSGR